MKNRKNDSVKKNKSEGFLNKKLFSIGKFNVTIDFVLTIALILVFVFGLIFAPRRYAVTTGRYNKGTPKQNRDVVNALGRDNTEERFEIYFQWYNVIHELGHGMIIYNGNFDDKYTAHEEQLVNEFAVAYWRYYGEEEKLAMLQDIVDYATTHIEGLDKNENYMKYGEKHWNESSFMSFNGYGWFQFNSTKKALEGDKSLDEVLKDMGVKDFNIPPAKKQVYADINEETSSEILNKAVENFRSWNLDYPDIEHKFNNDPNNNFSSPIVRIFGFIRWPDLFNIIGHKLR